MDGHFLTDIEIRQFKCFDGFKAAGFKRVNLIGGKNNIGKTALLEALIINVYAKNINTFLTALYGIKYAREHLNIINKGAFHQDILDATKSYSAQSNLKNTEFALDEVDAVKEYRFTIDGYNRQINAKELSVIIEYVKNINIIDCLGWPDAQLIAVFQAVQKLDKEEQLNRYIRVFDPSIESFKVIDKPQCKSNGRYQDLTEFGDGLKHYISIICALYACENGYLFIDEIDNGIHYSQLDNLWELILKLAKENNCQVFATTHSKEALDAFARMAKQLDEQDISYTTLVKNQQQDIKAITQNFEMLLYSMAQEHEVR